MKEAKELCECMKELIRASYIEKYAGHYYNPYYLYDEEAKVDEGQLCLEKEFFNSAWHENEELLYPINYCPICGKEIEYKMVRKKH